MPGQSQPQRKFRWARYIPAINSAATLLSAVATLVTAIIILFQLFEMQDSSKQTEQLLQNSTEQVAAARKSADATYNSLTMSQRAYVYAVPAHVFNVSPGKIPEPRVVFINSGQTFGKDTKRWARAFISKELSNEEILARAPGDLEPGTLVATPRTPHSIIRYAENVDQDTWQKLQSKSGDLRLYVLGRIEYTDVFNDQHFTNFCFMYFGEQQIWKDYGGPGFHSEQARYCGTYNDAN